MSRTKIGKRRVNRHHCSSCGVTRMECDLRYQQGHPPCCSRCEWTNTHGDSGDGDD